MKENERERGQGNNVERPESGPSKPTVLWDKCQGKMPLRVRSINFCRNKEKGPRKIVILPKVVSRAADCSVSLYFLL